MTIEESKDSVSSEGSESEESEEEKKVESVEMKVNYKLITQKLLIPFFSIHSRILEKGSKFEIGPIKF